MENDCIQDGARDEVIDINVEQPRRIIYSPDELLRLRNFYQIPNQLEQYQLEQLSSSVLCVAKNIDDIPLFMYKNYRAPNQNSECLICYDFFTETDLIRVLPCSHILHRRCIDDYLKNKSHCCPYCKNPVGEYAYSNM